MRVIWTISAISDLSDIRAYIAVDNPSAARRVGDLLLSAGDGLAIFPERGRPVTVGVRDLVAVWPYVIRYRVSATAVVILRVRHGARQS